jgi:DNA-binding transcriptional LysR family regulator
VQPFAGDELVLVAASTHALARSAALTAHDIGQQTVVLREPGSGTRQVTEEALARWQITPGRVLEVNHSEALKQAVMAGMGVSFVSRRAINLEAGQNLLAIVGGEQWRIPYQLATASRKDIRPPMTALSFLAYMRKRT